MSGRFWSPCVFLGALLAYDAVRRDGDALGNAGWLTVLALIALLPLLHPPSLFFRTRANKFGTMVMDEREFYADTNTLLNYSPSRRAIHHAFSQEGLAIRKVARSESGAGRKTTWITALVGMFGFHAGPEVIVIDRIGLGDPLLARLPLENRSKFPRPGHFIRVVPEGYEEARRSGSLAGMDPALAAYYAPLREIVSGPLFSWQRLATIASFNLGRYDHFRDAYAAARSARAEREPQADPAAAEAKPR
jgi:arabinofuranosyltransferase